jgi:hypothetical protein
MVAVKVEVGVSVQVCEIVGEAGVGEAVYVGEILKVGLMVGDTVKVGEMVGLHEFVNVDVGDCTKVKVGEAVGLGENVKVEVSVGLMVSVQLGVKV